MIQLREHFRSDDRSRHSQWLRQQRWFLKSRLEQARKEEATEKLQDQMLSLMAEVVMATEIQIEQFQAKIDSYDEATVIALMENQEKLDEILTRLSEVEIRIQDMLDRAYAMEDGRRVFLTEDRTKAFDETGTEVTRDELDFGLVPKNNPTWESLSKAFSEQDGLMADYKQAMFEREQILEFQNKIDEARERVADGEISKEELDDLDAELLDAMPPSVRANVPGFDSAENAPDLKSEFQSPADPSALTKTGATLTVAPAPEYNPVG